MPWTFDYSDAFANRIVPCKPVVLLGGGGAGRTAVRSVHRHIVQRYGPCPHVARVEWDLAADTSRTDTEPDHDFADDDAFPDLQLQHRVPGIKPREVFLAHGDDPDYGAWTSVDKDVAASADIDTFFLGGYASPAVTRLAMHVNADNMSEFALAVAKLADRIRAPRHAGWSCSEGGLFLLSFSSPCGSVGSNVLHVLDAVRTQMKGSFRIIHFALLLADRGRVTKRAEAQALQFAHLKEFDVRCQG